MNLREESGLKIDYFNICKRVIKIRAKKANPEPGAESEGDEEEALVERYSRLLNFFQKSSFSRPKKRFKTG